MPAGAAGAPLHYEIHTFQHPVKPDRLPAQGTTSGPSTSLTVALASIRAHSFVSSRDIILLSLEISRQW